MAAKKKPAVPLSERMDTSFGPERDASERKRAIKAIRDGHGFALLWQEVDEHGRVTDHQMIHSLPVMTLRGWIDYFRSWFGTELPFRDAARFNVQHAEEMMRRVLADCPHCKDGEAA